MAYAFCTIVNRMIFSSQVYLCQVYRASSPDGTDGTQRNLRYGIQVYRPSTPDGTDGTQQNLRYGIQVTRPSTPDGTQQNLC